MKWRLSVLVGVLLSSPVWGHPHEWVDWGVGLVVNGQKPAQVESAQLELTWDEWYTALVATDYPNLGKTPFDPAALAELDSTYGLGSPDRAVSLNVTFRGNPVKVKLVMQQPRYNGKQITFVYTFILGLKVLAPSELKVEIYDPTYYTDMGIRAKAGGFFLGAHGAAPDVGTFKYEQDFARGYYGGSVYPEVVAFALRP